MGHEVTAETREKIRQNKIGVRNGVWKGEEASYNAIHNWLFRHYGKSGVCDECGAERKTEWANVSGEYRRHRDDFLELCVPCHRRFDIANPKRPTRLAPSHLRIGEKNAS